MGTQENIVAGSHVWVEDPALAWVDGEVIRINGEEAEIQTSDGKMLTLHVSKVYPKDQQAPAEGIANMTNLCYLNEPGVLQNLVTRYELNKIYTYSGKILIAIIPFQKLPHLYDAHMMDQYKGAPFGKLDPHVFAIADVAYRSMINEEKSNSILTNGESGAGKTETTKLLMQYLAYLDGHSASEGWSIEKQILESDPVLEAFGNAKTAKNNNSSRFGKFVEIQFDKHGRISGAAVKTYLLERSRVCQISDPERNYHCFFYLCAAPPGEIEKYNLGNPKSFHYLNQSNCYELIGVNDGRDYLATRRAMDIVGISEKDQDAIFRVVAAILHLGNIYFAKGDDSDSSIPKDEESRFLLQTAAELLMCRPLALENALCKRMMITREEVIQKSLDTVGATVSRDGLAKTIYSRLFNWLIDKINFSIGQDPNSKTLIVVLDIYDFESFKTNRYCVLISDPLLFSLQKPGSVIALLDEACMFPRATYETFAQKLYQTYNGHKRFIKPKLARTDFTVAHYTGEEQCQTDLFLDENKDYVVPEHQDLLSASNCYFVAGLFPPLSEETAKSSKFSSIGSRLKLQLQRLIDTLNLTEPHFVRCVKPNNSLSSLIFEKSDVMQQLRCGGVLEAIKINCAGHATRMTFLSIPETICENEKIACERIMEKMGLKDYQVGKTEIFQRAGQVAMLDARSLERLSKAAKIIQSRIRAHIGRKNFVALRMAAIYTQSVWRDQFSGLKTILQTSLNSRSTSGPTARDDPADSTSRSSDSTSTESDFTFPAPTTSVSPQENQPLGSDSFNMMFQNLSVADLPEPDKRNVIEWGPLMTSDGICIFYLLFSFLTFVLTNISLVYIDLNIKD